MTRPFYSVSRLAVINTLSVRRWAVIPMIAALAACSNDDSGSSVTTIDLDVQVGQEDFNGAFYHYSHGLKKHAGNCQRIAHGHRSQIQIWLNGERSDTEETYWAERWQDIYIGSKEDLSSENADTLSFAYTAEQGDFSLTLAREHCYMMSTDSTVELIADHLAQEIKLRHPEQNVRVRAFEGVNKGAMVQR